MHIKTNIETSFIQIVVLALCPLLLMVNSCESALYYIVATAICFFCSVFICFVFNKFLSKTVKIFITAVFSTFVITIINFAIEKYGILGLSVSDANYFAVLSTIILCIDNVYLETKALVGKFFLRNLRTIVVFAVYVMVYAVLKEFLAFGTLFNKQIIKTYFGVEFFKTLAFDFILLGVICVIGEIINRAVSKKINQKNMLYEKYVKKIRNEKKFQYDELRRKKLLTTPIEVNKIDDEDAQAIKEKENENEAIEVVDGESEKSNEEQSKDKNKKKKRRKKLKVSKEAKIEKLNELGISKGDRNV